MGINMDLPPPNSSASGSFQAAADKASGNKPMEALDKSLSQLSGNLNKAEVDVINKSKDAALASSGALSNDRPNPEKPQLFASTLAAIKGSAGAGNPYFAPNPIAILSAATYKLYSILRETQLGMAHAENKGMGVSADMAKTQADAQRAAGKQQALSFYASMAMGAVQILGAFAQGAGTIAGSLATKGSSTAIKGAETAVDTAQDAVSKSAAKFGQAEKLHVNEVAKLSKLQDSKAVSASTGKLKDAGKVDLEIMNQKKVVDKARKQMEMASKNMNADKSALVSKEDLLKAANTQHQQHASNINALGMAFSTAINGAGQTVGNYVKAQAIINESEANAQVTINQTQQQLVQKGIIDSTHSAGESASQTMSGFLQTLDKAVDAHSQANNLKG